MVKVNRKGIILAGGMGSRLAPLTNSLSKQLLPIYDKPMIYYPLSTLMLAGIREILIITKADDLDSFQKLLGDGKNWGINIEYKVQLKPEGLAQAFIIGREFIGASNVALILGDNLFHGDNFSQQLKNADNKDKGGTIFAYPVIDPERYGVVHFDENMNVIDIEEKPTKPKSNYAVTGLYFYDNSVLEKVLKIKPSHRGELEITDLNRLFLKELSLSVEIMSRGTAWLDTGTFDSLQDAGSYIRTLESRQGLKICCPEEIAWRSNWIDNDTFKCLAEKLKKNSYGEYLMNLINQ